MSEGQQLAGGRYENPEGENGPKGFAAGQEYAKLEVDFPAKIEVADIKPHAIGRDETEVILQRHGDYVRDRNDEQVGSITEESAQKVSQTAREYFEGLFDQIPRDEWGSVDILFVASDTAYFGGGQRSLETAILSQRAAESVLQERGVPAENIHNARGQLKGNDAGPRPMPGIREPQFLDNNPDFAQHLLEKYSQTEGPDGQKKIDIKFWIAFEEDLEAELRQEMGAEGPDDIADRTKSSLNALAIYAQMYHKLNPGRRLVIWASTHYDTISPFVRREVFQQPNYKEQALGVELGGGMTIDIDKDGKATTELSGQQWEVPVRSLRKRPETPEN